MHDLRGNFFLNGKRRRGKERRKGEGKRGNEGERGGKGGGEKGTESFFNEQIFIQNRIKPTNYTCILYTKYNFTHNSPLTPCCYSIRPRNAFPKTNNIFL